MAVIEIKSLTKHFGSTKAVDKVSLAVEKGEIFGFLGPNGAGKTTTIRMMMDFLRPDSGEVKIFGLNVITEGVAARQRIGYMPAVTSLNERWTGTDHIEYAKALRRQTDMAEELAKRLEFDVTKKAKHLSTGNRQKLSLILAFMFKPELIILDEPTNGLDPLLQQTVYELIGEAHRRGATIFMSSHNLNEVEKICTRVGVLRAGKLIAQETIASLQDKHLYHVILQFEIDFDQSPFKIPSIEIVHAHNRGLTMKVSGEIQPLLEAVAKAKPHDVTINHATLEEHFMEFYNR